MNCPHCNIPLMMTDRKGIEIDFCSRCRGIWLDKGELDKIIELSIQERFSSRSGQHSSHKQSDWQNEVRRTDTYHKPRKPHYAHQKPYYKHKKRKTLLGEIFDIFD